MSRAVVLGAVLGAGISQTTQIYDKRRWASNESIYGESFILEHCWDRVSDDDFVSFPPTKSQS